MYFLVRWADPTYSIDRQRWTFDGSTWTRQDQTPLREGGANTGYEDKLAFLWVMDSRSVVEDESFWPTYRDDAEAAAVGYDRPVHIMPEGERLDMWHFKYVRTNFTTPGQVDDQFMDDDTERANAGRGSDPGENGYYTNVKHYTDASGATVQGPRYHVPGNTNLYILTQDMIDRGEAVEIADHAELMALPAGTHLAAVIGRAFTGARGDTTAKAVWSDGWYTLSWGVRSIPATPTTT